MEQSPSHSSSSSHSTPNHCSPPFQPSHCRSPSPVNEPFELSPRLRRDLLVYTLDSSLVFPCIFAIRSSFRLNLPESLSPGPSESLGLPSCYSSASSYTSNIDHISSLERDFCSNFTCCGLRLSDLHELLEHFEEFHIIVINADGTPIYPCGTGHDPAQTKPNPKTNSNSSATPASRSPTSTVGPCFPTSSFSSDSRASSQPNNPSPHHHHQHQQQHATHLILAFPYPNPTLLPSPPPGFGYAYALDGATEDELYVDPNIAITPGFDDDVDQSSAYLYEPSSSTARELPFVMPPSTATACTTSNPNPVSITSNLHTTPTPQSPTYLFEVHRNGPIGMLISPT